MKPFRYTKKIHIPLLLEMLEKEKPCQECPMLILERKIGETIPNNIRWSACKVCKKYIGMPDAAVSTICPCYKLGQKEAIKRTWLALERDGYA